MKLFRRGPTAANSTDSILEQRPAAVFLLVVNAIMVTVAGGYSVVNFGFGYAPTAAAQLVAAVLNLGSIVLVARSLRRHTVAVGARRFTLVSVVILALVLVFGGGGRADVSVFMVLVPPVVVFLASRRAAAALNLGFLAILVVSALRPGTTAWVPAGTDGAAASVVAFAVLVVYATMIAELRYRALQRVESLAAHDPVTGLRRFDPREGRTVGGTHGVLIQLRQTDQLRLQGGNRFVQRVMITLAQRIARYCGASDQVYAYGETSFLVIPTVKDGAWSQWIGPLVAELGRPVAGQERSHTPQLAVYVVPDAPGLGYNELAERLETTMQGKRDDRQHVAVYNPAIATALRERLELSDHLRHARARDELFLVYQPLVDAIDGAVVGAEVLMRWKSPRFGMVPPATFIPLAEELGVIGELTEWMLARAWYENTADSASPVYPQLSVNLSPADMECPDFIERLSRLVGRTGMDPRRVDIEITEGLLLRDSVVGRGVLDRLVEMGFSLSIDDFGTGYSNLSYLRSLNVHRVKIDRSFVMDLFRDDGTANSRAAPLVEAMVFMARTLGIHTLAEGVESQAEADLLRELGCESFQGYLFARPQPLGSPQTNHRGSAHAG